jgi:hypothetical protein
MLDATPILGAVSLLLTGVLGYAVFLLKTGTEAAVRTTAEEMAKATVQQLQWPGELARELQKTRGVERQELRYQSYGALWKALRPLAIYDAAPISKEVVRQLSLSLSNWYFSECGGFLLTSQARYFYFAVQDLLQATSRLPADWDADRSEEAQGDQNARLTSLAERRSADKAIGELGGVLKYFKAEAYESWHESAPDLGRTWRKGISKLSGSWMELDGKERFTVLQQAGSLLRTSLVNDVEARLG